MKKLLKKVTSITLVLSMIFVMSTTAFAADDTANDSATPLITDVQTNDYIEKDGTYISSVTFYEDEIFSSIVKVVNPDGSYTVTLECNGQAIL